MVVERPSTVMNRSDEVGVNSDESVAVLLSSSVWLELSVGVGMFESSVVVDGISVEDVVASKIPDKVSVELKSVDEVLLPRSVVKGPTSVSKVLETVEVETSTVDDA